MIVNTPDKADGLLTTPLETSSIITIGSASGSHHGHLGNVEEFRFSWSETLLCADCHPALSPSHLPRPCWFSELPLTVSWKLIARLSDSVRSSDLCQEEKKEFWFQQGVSTPLLASICQPAPYYAVRVHTGLFKPIHHCSGKFMLWCSSLDGVFPIAPSFSNLESGAIGNQSLHH